MANASFTFDGSGFKRVALEVEKASDQALQAVAMEVAGEAKKLTPVDTGRLRSSITYAYNGKTNVHSESYSGGAISYSATAPEGEAHVGTNVEYAVFVHEDLHGNVPRAGGVGENKFIEKAFARMVPRIEFLVRRFFGSVE